MIIRCFISFLIFLACLPLAIISVPVVMYLLHTSWDGTTTIFGNAKWGRATSHFVYPTNNSFWREFIWFVWRNSLNNLKSQTLGAKQKAHKLTGDKNIGDKIAGGFYKIKMGVFWEYYWIKPYTVLGLKRCIRARIGWKIKDNVEEKAQCVFTINLVKAYSGV